MAQTHTGSGTKSSKVNKAVGLKGSGGKGTSGKNGDKAGRKASSASGVKSSFKSSRESSTATGDSSRSDSSSFRSGGGSSRSGSQSASQLGRDDFSSDERNSEQKMKHSKRSSAAPYQSSDRNEGGNKSDSSAQSSTNAEYSLSTNENHPNTVTTNGATPGNADTDNGTGQGATNGRPNQISQQLSKLSGSLRDHAVGQTGAIASVSERLASGIDSGSRYFQNKQPLDVKNSLAEAVRQYPIPAALLGIGLGLIISSKLEKRQL